MRHRAVLNLILASHSQESFGAFTADDSSSRCEIRAMKVSNSNDAEERVNAFAFGNRLHRSIAASRVC